MHCSASCATRDSRFKSWLCRIVVLVRGRVGRQGCLCSVTHTSDSCGGTGAVYADSRQVHSVSFDTLVRLASGLSGLCVNKQCGLVGLCFRGRTALDLRLSESVRVLQRWNKTVTTNWIPRKRGKKYLVLNVFTYCGGKGTQNTIYQIPYIKQTRQHDFSVLFYLWTDRGTPLIYKLIICV
jgi:hypothetical protein